MSGVSANLSSYVPTPVVRHFGADPTPLTAAAAERVPSAVLFADISGFTALTERLASRGPVGAEEISRLLNGYFAEVIDLVSAHGGDVVRVAGDAIFALWQDSGAPHDVGKLTLRAAQCGLALQTAYMEMTGASGLSERISSWRSFRRDLRASTTTSAGRNRPYSF